jgi:hypothetical protein
MCLGFFVVGFSFSTQVEMLASIFQSLANKSHSSGYTMPILHYCLIRVSPQFLLNVFVLISITVAWTGVMHGFFGLGAFASPLVATAMVSRGIPVRTPACVHLGFM